ncbi:MAG: flagellar basal body-associated protein FliL [Paracoccaceae bacterium]
MRKLLPVILVLLGLGVGLAAGLFLRPEPIAPDEQEADPKNASKVSAESEQPAEFAKMPNQFIVPIIEEGRIASLIILTLSLEVSQGGTEAVFAQEPKLRDGLLQLMFDHANTGGFRGSFTASDNLVVLRHGLTEVARRILGDTVRSVLITDFIRQDNE